jgi:hypothetical protein
MKQPETQPQPDTKKQAEIKVGMNDTGDGIEIQQGAVELDVNVVQETVSIQVHDKTWFSVSFRCLGGFFTCFSNLCTKPQVVSQENPVAPVAPVPIEPVAPVPVQK